MGEISSSRRVRQQQEEFMMMTHTNNSNNNINNNRNTTITKSKKKKKRSRRRSTFLSSSVGGCSALKLCLLVALCLVCFDRNFKIIRTVTASDDVYDYYYNYANDDANANANGDDANANANGDDAAAYDDAADYDDAAAYDDANAAAYDDAYVAADDANNGDDANANGDDANNWENYNYDYQNAVQDDTWSKAFQDDYIDLDMSDGFDTISIMPTSCVNYNNGHMIKFEIYETANSYQCHFAQVGTFVVSIAHYMRAYFNYRALVDGNDFSLPYDVGYLNCIPLKLDAYWQYGERFGYGDDDAANANNDDAAENDGNDEDNDDQQQQQQQNVLYAKVGCMKHGFGTFSSAKFQLHVYTDNMCTVEFDDGQLSQKHSGSYGKYDIDFNKYYTLDDDNNNNGGNNNGEENILQFSTQVSFRPTFYQCSNCKPDSISETFNKFSSAWYDDAYISQYNYKQQQYDEAVEEEEEAAEGDDCADCQYYAYNDDVDGYNTNDDAAAAAVDDAYVATDDGAAAAAAVDDAYYNAVDDAYMAVTNDDGGGGGDDDSKYNYYYTDDYNNVNRRRRLGGEGELSAVVAVVATLSQSQAQSQSQSQSYQLAPVQKELVKFEVEFWNHIEEQRQREEDRRLGLDSRQLYDNQYGGVDDWNMCEQVYKYGLYCDEQCQALDAFTHSHWTSSGIALVSIMVTFMVVMMLLIVAKRLKASKTHRKQRAFFTEHDYDPETTSISRNNIPGFPPLAMFLIFVFVMLIITTLALLQFVNETLVFAVVCCILLFIYMLKLTLFKSTRNKPVLLASPNHEDVFGFKNDDYDSQATETGICDGCFT